MNMCRLYVMDKRYNGTVLKSFDDTLWFTPVVWHILLEKYVAELFVRNPKLRHQIGKEAGRQAIHQLNDRLALIDEKTDRVCWELSHEQVFFTKDKEVIADALLQFTVQNLDVIRIKGESLLESRKVFNRFTELAAAIRGLDENVHPYFVFQSTGVDDNVRDWFRVINEKTGQYETRTLRDAKDVYTEFVYIKRDGRIHGFYTNLEYFEEFAKDKPDSRRTHHDTDQTQEGDETE